jgi:MFS family permease
MLGQVLVPLYPVTHAGSFMLAAILSALAIVPVALTRAEQPAPISVVRLQPRRLYRAAPVALVASGMIGVANGAFWGLGALSVGASGLSVDEVAWFMGTAVLAGAVVQWPLGRLSDRIDRRLVLLPTLVGAAIVGVALWSATASGSLLLALAFLFGALAFPGYALAAAHGYDKVPGGDMVATAATILFANGLGSAIGPLLASAVMAGFGPRGLFLFTAVAQVLLAVFVFYRTRVQPSLPPQAKTGFDLATTAPVATAVAYELIEPGARQTDSPTTDELAAGGAAILAQSAPGKATF